jgi:hypothetical protein
MIFSGLTNALRGISGEFEVNRVVGAFGAVAYVICGNGFVAWNMAKGQAFNVTEYCLAFPGGLAVAVGAIAGAVAIKGATSPSRRLSAIPARCPARPRTRQPKSRST